MMLMNYQFLNCNKEVDALILQDAIGGEVEDMPKCPNTFY
jgi:hypothetical protein